MSSVRLFPMNNEKTELKEDHIAAMRKALSDWVKKIHLTADYGKNIVSARVLGDYETEKTIIGDSQDSAPGVLMKFVIAKKSVDRIMEEKIAELKAMFPENEISHYTMDVFGNSCDIAVFIVVR